QLIVTARPITVTADKKTKIYGDADPTLTYRVASGNLVNDDAFSGALSRAAGENVTDGPYVIAEGTLTGGTNYLLSYVPDVLTITPATLTATADNEIKLYGSANPILT